MTPPAAERRLEVYDPDLIRNRLNRTMRRRLSDDLESLIRKACMVGQPSTAEELLAVLRNLLDAESKRFPRDRRITDGVIEALLADIATARSRKTAA